MNILTHVSSYQPGTAVITLYKATTAARAVLAQIEKEREGEGLPRAYRDMHDAMLDVHTELQTMDTAWKRLHREYVLTCDAVKRKHTVGAAAAQALRLTAAALKFAADLGDDGSLRSFTENGFDIRL